MVANEGRLLLRLPNQTLTRFRFTKLLNCCVKCDLDLCPYVLDIVDDAGVHEVL